MSQLSSTKLTIEAFKDQKWISPLLSALNQQTSELLAAFKNGFNISENLYQELKEITFENQTANFPLQFGAKFGTIPLAVMIVYCHNNTDATTVAITSLPLWEYTNGNIKITSISGLTTGKIYTIRVHAIYG